METDTPLGVSAWTGKESGTLTLHNEHIHYTTKVSEEKNDGKPDHIGKEESIRLKQKTQSGHATSKLVQTKTRDPGMRRKTRPLQKE